MLAHPIFSADRLSTVRKAVVTTKASSVISKNSIIFFIFFGSLSPCFFSPLFSWHCCFTLVFPDLCLLKFGLLKLSLHKFGLLRLAFSAQLLRSPLSQVQLCLSVSAKILPKISAVFRTSSMSLRLYPISSSMYFDERF